MANRTFRLEPAADADLVSIFHYTSQKSGLTDHPVRSHIIFYRPTDCGVMVLRVLHKAMDYPRHF